MRYHSQSELCGITHFGTRSPNGYVDQGGADEDSEACAPGDMPCRGREQCTGQAEAILRLAEKGTTSVDEVTNCGAPRHARARRMRYPGRNRGAVMDYDWSGVRHRLRTALILVAVLAVGALSALAVVRLFDLV